LPLNNTEQDENPADNADVVCAIEEQQLSCLPIQSSDIQIATTTESNCNCSTPWLLYISDKTFKFSWCLTKVLCYYIAIPMHFSQLYQVKVYPKVGFGGM